MQLLLKIYIIVVNFFIVYELNRWSKDLNAQFTLKECLLGNFRISKNAHPDKYFDSGYEI